MNIQWGKKFLIEDVETSLLNTLEKLSYLQEETCATLPEGNESRETI